MRHRKNNSFIDFKTLNNNELKNLTSRWEGEARVFEAKLQHIMSKPNVEESKVEHLWGVGKRLWRKVSLLENWKRKNNKF